MIWHFFEVWVLMLAAFALGCPIGAAAYKLIAGSPLAELQGDFADMVGDIVDGIKSRLGIGPVWRPEYRRVIERASHDADDMGDHGGFGREGAGWQDRLPASDTLLIADHRPEADDAGGVALADVPATAALEEARRTAESEEPATARPVALAAPRNSVPDDLQRIRGIGRRIEQRLNGLGIFHFGQIAAWTPAEMRWIAQQLAFPERIERDDWIGQAIILAAGGSTGFVKSADRRRARRQQRALERAIERGADEDDTIEREVDDASGEALAEEEEVLAGAEDESAEKAELPEAEVASDEEGAADDEDASEDTPAADEKTT